MFPGSHPNYVFVTKIPRMLILYFTFLKNNDNTKRHCCHRIGLYVFLFSLNVSYCFWQIALLTCREQIVAHICTLYSHILITKFIEIVFWIQNSSKCILNSKFIKSYFDCKILQNIIFWIQNSSKSYLKFKIQNRFSNSEYLTLYFFKFKKKKKSERPKIFDTTGTPP